MFEHMAFKGTTEIGTTDYPAEKIALAKVEVAYAAYDAEYRKRVGQSPEKLAQLSKVFQDAEAEAQKYVIPNEFSAIAEENGAVGINASTGEDSTQYFWSMPSNRLELWAYLESQRIGQPVEREFYKERNVVQEERRMRVDSDPVGRMIEQFLATAYVAHPYRRPGVGWESEISQVSATEATDFHEKYYVPSNIVIAVVGDVKAAEAMPVLERYFAPIPAGPQARADDHRRTSASRRENRRSSAKPPSPSTSRATIAPTTATPTTPSTTPSPTSSPTAAPPASIAASCATSRSPPKLRASADFPDTNTPASSPSTPFPCPATHPTRCAQSIHKELDRLKNEDVSDEELQRFKTRARADLLRGLGNNEGLAHQLAEYQTRFGDWRQLFRQLNKIDAVNKADMRRVANKIFIDSNRTSARIEFVAPERPAPGAPRSRTCSTQNAGGAQ